MSETAKPAGEPEPDALQRVLDGLMRERPPFGGHERHDSPLFHYTDAAGFRGIFNNRCVWATDYRFLNDRQEMVYGERAFVSVAAELSTDKSVPEMQQVILGELVRLYDMGKTTRILTPYVASFSEVGDLLSQWRAYSADGAGYSKGFTDFGLPATPVPDAPLALWLVRCRYGLDWLKTSAKDTLLQLSKRFVEATEPHRVDEESATRVITAYMITSFHHASTLVPRVKHEAFAEEREFRLIAVPVPGREREVVEYRPSPRGLIPYISLEFASVGNLLGVSRVFVGPTQDSDSGISAAAGFLDSLGYSGQDLVQASQVPYRGNR